LGSLGPMVESTEGGKGLVPETAAPDERPALFDREEHPSGEAETVDIPAEAAADPEPFAAPIVEPPPPALPPTPAAAPAPVPVLEPVPDPVPAARPKPPRWRERVIPKTALGMSMLILAVAVGSAFSGVVLYAYYEYRLTKTDTRVSNFINGEARNLANAQGQINAARDSAMAQIQQELAPLKQLTAQGETLQALIRKVAPSMFFVHTLDEAGQPSVGSAFVVASDSTQSLLLTSYTTIRAATHNPRPDVFARQGAVETKVTVWTWQEAQDLALLILPKGNLAHLSFVAATPPPQVGDRIFAVSGLGTAGAAVTQGSISDVASVGIQHNAAIAPAFQGGPLVDSTGNVVAVASRAYAPLNFSTDSVWFGVPIHDACDKVLVCPPGAAATAGAQHP
jgi:S1-C subfamily serine protease